jgi:hypothetical protein
LIQINIVWTSEGTPASDETVVGTANSLRDYFSSQNYKQDSAVANRPLAENTILIRHVEAPFAHLTGVPAKVEATKTKLAAWVDASTGPGNDDAAFTDALLELGMERLLELPYADENAFEQLEEIFNHFTSLSKGLPASAGQLSCHPPYAIFWIGAGVGSPRPGTEVRASYFLNRRR